MNYKQGLTTTFIIITLLVTSLSTFAQINSDQYDIYIKDTLLIDASQVVNLQTLDVEIQKTISFTPKTDGHKTYHYLSGKKYSSGLITEKKPDGAWTSWYENGHTNKKVIFVNGSKEGAYESYYENGNKNAEGQYKNDLREGDWIFYNQDGSLMGNYKYVKGQTVK